MIFYFTATGNCLYVARELAERLGDSQGIRSIPQEMARDGRLEYQDDTIGIVYPLYAHLMPTMVREFIHRATFDTPYLYFICTYGNRHANAVELCENEAQSAGLDPAYINTLLMVDNWLPGFDMDVQRSLIPKKRIPENLSSIVEDLAARKRWLKPVTDADRAAHEEFMKLGISFEAPYLGGFLTIEDTCIGCGTCVQVCPAGCITMEEGSAVRDAMAGLGCNACLACMQACPVHAITCSLGDLNPEARFRNENVALGDIIAANQQRG